MSLLSGENSEPWAAISMRILKAGALYFAVVFAAGFVLGTIRTLWVVPRVGVRTAELMESPLMLIVTVLAAAWVVRRCKLPFVVSTRLAVGLLALAFMLSAELGFTLWLRGLTVRQYLASRDPVSGTVYFVLLGVFAVLPVLVGRK